MFNNDHVHEKKARKACAWQLTRPAGVHPVCRLLGDRGCRPWGGNVGNRVCIEFEISEEGARTPSRRFKTFPNKPPFRHHFLFLARSTVTRTGWRMKLQPSQETCRLSYAPATGKALCRNALGETSIKKLSPPEVKTSSQVCTGV